MNIQRRVSIEGTKNIMCYGNKLVYTRVIRSLSWLVAVEKVIFVNELTDTVKDNFLKDFRATGEERNWSIVIYYLFRVLFYFFILELCYHE